VKERLLCHAIIGRAGGKELVKKVKIVCDFINPLLQFSTQSICFTVRKVETFAILFCNELVLTSVHKRSKNGDRVVEYCAGLRFSFRCFCPVVLGFKYVGINFSILI